MPDPIAQLVDDLAREGRPSLPWMIEWSLTGGDPLQTAWRASGDPAAMIRLLSAHRSYDAARRIVLGRFNVSISVFRLGRWPRVHLSEHGAPVDHARIAAAIRKVVPQPPTLDELLARAR